MSASLLGRIRQRSGRRVRGLATADEARAEVAEHLAIMLSTRAGSCLTCPDYGMVSVADVVHSCPDAIGSLVASIQATVEKYEPRLARVRVKHVASAPSAVLEIRFEMTADLVWDGRRSPVRFDTVISASRSVSVR